MRQRKVPGTANGPVTLGRECTKLLGVAWVRRGFWRRPVARRFECGAQLRVTKQRAWCPLCARDGLWRSPLPPRTVWTFTAARRERALAAALELEASR
jgi:hypothetical protein